MLWNNSHLIFMSVRAKKNLIASYHNDPKHIHATDQYVIVANLEQTVLVFTSYTHEAMGKEEQSISSEVSHSLDCPFCSSISRRSSLASPSDLEGHLVSFAALRNFALLELVLLRRWTGLGSTAVNLSLPRFQLHRLLLPIEFYTSSLGPVPLLPPSICPKFLR